MISQNSNFAQPSDESHMHYSEGYTSDISEFEFCRFFEYIYNFAGCGDIPRI